MLRRIHIELVIVANPDNWSFQQVEQWVEHSVDASEGEYVDTVIVMQDLKKIEEEDTE